MKKSVIVALIARTILSSAELLNARAADAESPFQPLSKEVRTILEDGETFVLLSLHPEPQNDDRRQVDFYGHKILGKVQIKDATSRLELLVALNTAVEKACAENRKGIAKCFNPRHAIKATAGTNEVDLLICFECSQIRIFKRKESNLTLVTDEPAKLFNQTLRKARVRLAPKEF